MSAGIETRAGLRLRSAVCETQLVVIRPAAGPVDLRCGGFPVVGMDDPAPVGEPDPVHRAGTAIGKRYADPATGLEVLCTKAGAGSLTLGEEDLPVKQAKPLPASD